MGSELILRLPLGWAMKPLIECTSDNIISYGVVQPGSHTETGIPIIRVNNFGNGKLDLSTVLKIEPEIERKFSRTRLIGGEVLLTLVGSTGQSIVASKELAGWNVPRAVAVIRPSNDIGANWINICLQTEFTKNFLDSRANTTVQKTLNLADVKKIPIPIPPNDVKDFIESNIISLDNKIQLNRETNQTLESMAQALFKSWFVDFDPVFDNIIADNLAHNNAPLHNIPEPLLPHAQRRLNVLNEGQNNADNVERDSAQQVSAARAFHHLFPQAFEQSDEPSVGIQGWIPQGWGVKQIKDFGLVVCGKTPSKKEAKNFGGSTPFIKIPDMHGRVFPVHTTDTLSEEGAALQKKKEIPSGSVCVSSIATVGKVVIAPYASHTNQQINSIVPLKKEWTPFIYFSMLELENKFHDLASGGSATLNMNTSVFSRTEVLMPVEVLLNELHRITKYVFGKILENEENIITLESLRDTLLPKLISGELRIPDAEQPTEALAK